MHTTSTTRTPHSRRLLGKLGLFALAMFSLPMVACADTSGAGRGTSADELRGLNKQEALAELGQIGDALRASYGPLEYKQERFGFVLDDALAAAKAEIEAGASEADFIRPVYGLLAKLHDGHVSYAYPMKGDQSSEFRLPFIVTPFGNDYAVTAVLATPEDVASFGMAKGDTLVSIDGKGTEELEKRALALVGNGAPESEKHYAGVGMTIRPFYTPKDLQPSGPTAEVILRHADGSEYTATLPWTVTRGGLAGGVLPTEPKAASTGLKLGGAGPMAYSSQLAYLLAQRDGAKVGPEATIVEQGSLTPYFLTPEVREALGVVEVFPAPATLESFGVKLPETEASAPEAARVIQLHAYKYRFEGKTILLVRIPTYSLANAAFAENVGWLAGLLQENLKAAGKVTSVATTPADVVVLDDSHNPGGSIGFGTGLVSLFATAPIPNVVQAHNADRKWIDTYSGMLGQLATLSPELAAPVGAAVLERRAQMEAVYDADGALAPFTPFGGSQRGPTVPEDFEALVGENMLAPHPQVNWNKPVLVLIDELAGSCADIVPMLLKDSGIAKTFGTRTMGLGGNVEPILTLPFSRATLSATRGLFGAYKANPAEIRLIENNGVTPDYPYAHTVADYRAGYVGYAKSFSKVAATLTR
jgi:hypothetical protein